MNDSVPDSSASVSDGLTDRILGDFRLLRRLGVGGMAEVFLAEQLSLKRFVAVKILQNDAVSGTKNTLLKRFEQEARAAGGLSHPNIVQVFMIGQQDDLHYIVQEYVQGQNLSQWFKRNGPPEFLTGLKWMVQVATALKAASDAGIVHRDIKPENIMLTRAGVAKVTDFGLAQLNEPTEKMNLTQAGTTMGTPWYMSPEQIQGEKLDHRSDQYSFGVTCYQMFAGQPPFPGKNSVSVAVQHLKEEPVPLSQHRQDLPEALCRVIHRMLQKSPKDRFESPDALLSALEGLENEPLSPALSDTSTLSRWLVASLPSWKAMLTMLAVCVAVGVVSGRKLLEPVRLIASAEEISAESTAAEQFAEAVLPPHTAAKWRAVFRHFPESNEARSARLQLGVYYMDSTPPDYGAAFEQFKELETETALYPDELREMRFLAFLGQALVADRQDNSDLSDRIVQTILLTNYLPEVEADVITSPETLEEYRTALRDRFSPNE